MSKRDKVIGYKLLDGSTSIYDSKGRLKRLNRRKLLRLKAKHLDEILTANASMSGDTWRGGVR